MSKKIKIRLEERVGFEPTRNAEVTIDLDLLKDLNDHVLSGMFRHYILSLEKALEELPKHRPFVNIGNIEKPIN